jgi:hypothetical protein
MRRCSRWRMTGARGRKSMLPFLIGVKGRSRYTIVQSSKSNIATIEEATSCISWNGRYERQICRILLALCHVPYHTYIDDWSNNLILTSRSLSAVRVSCSSLFIITVTSRQKPRTFAVSREWVLSLSPNPLQIPLAIDETGKEAHATTNLRLRPIYT